MSSGGYMNIILHSRAERVPFEREISVSSVLIMTNTQPGRWIVLNDFVSFSKTFP